MFRMVEDQPLQINPLDDLAVAQPPDPNLSGWPSMLRDGAEVPVFDYVTLLHAPVNPTDAVSLQYVLPLTGVQLPTSNAGLKPGTLWNNAGFICVA